MCRLGFCNFGLLLGLFCLFDMLFAVLNLGLVCLEFCLGWICRVVWYFGGFSYEGLWFY